MLQNVKSRAASSRAPRGRPNTTERAHRSVPPTSDPTVAAIARALRMPTSRADRLTTRQARRARRLDAGRPSMACYRDGVPGAQRVVCPRDQARHRPRRSDLASALWASVPLEPDLSGKPRGKPRSSVESLTCVGAFRGTRYVSAFARSSRSREATARSLRDVSCTGPTEKDAVMRPLVPGDEPVEFYLDAPAHPAWSPLVLVVGEPRLCLDGLVAVRGPR